MNAPEDILAYLKGRLPAYPFDPRLDAEFVEELITEAMDRQCQGEKEGRVGHPNRQTPSQDVRSVPDSTATARIRD